MSQFEIKNHYMYNAVTGMTKESSNFCLNMLKDLTAIKNYL